MSEFDASENLYRSELEITHRRSRNPEKWARRCEYAFNKLDDARTRVAELEKQAIENRRGMQRMTDNFRHDISTSEVKCKQLETKYNTLRDAVNAMLDDPTDFSDHLSTLDDLVTPDEPSESGKDGPLRGPEKSGDE